jgi:prophage maintenance system killer protein
VLRFEWKALAHAIAMNHPFASAFKRMSTIGDVVFRRGREGRLLAFFAAHLPCVVAIVPASARITAMASW